jgi:hypothetical protein
MSTDDVIHMIANQWERGLIVPMAVSGCELNEALDRAGNEGLVVQKPYRTKSGKSVCHVLTESGWLRFGELTGSTIHFVEA